MIVGDKIATLNLTRNSVPQIVEVIAIEKHEIKWRHRWTTEIENMQSIDKWHFSHVYLSSWVNLDGSSGVHHAEGRVRKRDRGLTWCPAWIECEVEALTVSVGLSPEFKTDP